MEASVPAHGRGIVDFDDPPVIEVALAVQFESPVVDTLDVASFAGQVRKEFPRREEQAPRPPIDEQFGPPTASEPFRIEVFDRPPMPRFWLLSEDGAHLIQIQHDLFALNWRRQGDADAYPHYGKLRDAIHKHLLAFDEVLTQGGKSGVRPNWCDVTYVNHIPALDRGSRRPLSEVLAFIDPIRSDFLPQPEDAQVVERFQIREDDAQIGRLTCGVTAAVRTADAAPIWVLTLTARVRVDGSLDDAFHRLDHGREWVARGFCDLTTPEMHTLWGLRGTA